MELKHKIESILFIIGEPVSEKKLAKILEVPQEETRKALEELRSDYANRGIVILQKEDEWQFGTSPEHAGLIEHLVKSEFTEELSRAALETLTIVAYRGPLTRHDLDFIRGVNSSFMLRNLLLRGLVERVENPKDARSYLYKISFDFLKHLGLGRVEDLPQYAENRALVDEALSQFAPVPENPELQDAVGRSKNTPEDHSENTPGHSERSEESNM